MSCGDMIEFYFIHKLLHQEMERCLSRCAAYLGLSVLELQVLWIAGSSDTFTLADMARVTTFTKETLEEIVVALERDDLVQEVRFGESLCVYFRATDRGKDTINQLSSRVNSYRCPVNTDQDSVRSLLEASRKLVMELKGKGSCDLIANMARGVR